MKSIIMKVVSCLVTMIITIIILSRFSDIMQRKASDYKYIPFFKHAEDIDVLFLGTSHMLNAVYPMELWKEYGITSYNFGGHSTPIPTDYWILENALDYANPKAVVVDCMMVSGGGKTSSSYEHISTDAFPLTTTKIRAVFDLLDDTVLFRNDIGDEAIDKEDDNKKEKLTRLGLIWDYSVYHDRWEAIGKDDFVQDSTVEYGAESRIKIMAPGTIVENPGDKIKEETNGIKYLERIIKECQSRGIVVVLTYLPFPNDNKNKWREANTVKDISKKYNVLYIDFLENDIVDFETDCHDPNSHLNPSGAFKITDYIGVLLRNEYEIPDHRGDERFAYWNDDYNTYADSKKKRLNEIEDLNTFLMLLEDREYDYVMSVGDQRIFEDSTTIKLLKNKGIDTQKIENTTQYIMVRNGQSVLTSNINDIESKMPDIDEMIFVMKIIKSEL